jgi:hypothetical protein
MVPFLLFYSDVWETGYFLTSLHGLWNLASRRELHTSGPAGAGVGEREYSTVVPWFDACVAGLI